MRPKTLAQDLLLGVVPLVLAPLLGVGFGAYALARQRILQGVQRDVDALAGRVASDWRAYLGQRSDDLEALAEVPLFAEAFLDFDIGLKERAERTLADIEHYLARFSRRVRAYERLAFVDAAGRELAAVEYGRVVPPSTKSARPPFLDAVLEGRAWSSGLQEGPDGPAQVYAAPLLDHTGRPRGAIVLECALAPVLEDMNRLYASGGGAYLESAPGRPALGSRPAPEEALTGRAPVPGSPWTVVLLVDSSPYLAPLKAFGRWTAALALFACAFAGLLVVRRVRRAMAPLEDMEGGARELGSGNLAYRFTEPSTKELQSLAREFNALARGLQTRNRELEERIRELAALHEHLDESEAHFRTVLENSPVAVLGLTAERAIASWNRGAEQIFGWAEAEIVGKPFAALFPLAAEADLEKVTAEVSAKGAVRDWAIGGLAKGGKALDLSVSWAGPPRGAKRGRGSVVVVRDETEARKLQKQVAQSEKLSLVGRLISGIAHELNNPLQSVVGYAQLMERRGQAAPDDLRRVHENAQRCRRIIENLLLFVRQGKVVVKPVRVDEAVRASLELLHYKLNKAADVDVAVDLSPDLRARADFQQLEQVIVNLINNAYDAMAGRDGPRRLRISGRAADGKVRVEIADSGPGVPPEARARLFEPFYTTKPEGQGTGLGLATCRQIMEEHGGAIGHLSPKEGGALFWIELPAAPGGAKPKETPAPPAAPVGGGSVLVMDDDPDILVLLRRALEVQGFRVETAGSVALAEAAAARTRFDIVVADVRLGPGSGFSFYDTWPDKASRPPFLFLTGDVLNGALKRSIEERGSTLLYKPVDLEEFGRAVNALMPARGGR